MERAPIDVMQALQEVEATAEDVLAHKQQLVQLDKRRHQTRGALRALHKESKTKKSWVCFGNMFIKMEKPKAKWLLDKDFTALDDEVGETRAALKKKVIELRDLENKEEIKGLGLTSLSKEDLQSISDLV